MVVVIVRERGNLMSSANILVVLVVDLYQSWQVLRHEQFRLRAREVAAQLGVSEAELTASRLGVDAQRLRPDWAELLPALGSLGSACWDKSSKLWIWWCSSVCALVWVVVGNGCLVVVAVISTSGSLVGVVARVREGYSNSSAS